jgi:hypothetical protein
VSAVLASRQDQTAPCAEAHSVEAHCVGSALLTCCPGATMLSRNNNDGDHVKLSIEDFREALNIVGDAAGQEAAIVAQFALDLEVTAQFRADGARIEPAKAQQLLRLRIARHWAAQQMSSVAVH